LGGYVTNTSLSSTLAGYVTDSELASALANYVTDSELSSALASYATQTFVTTTIADTHLDELSDVFQEASVANNEILAWNSGQSRWQNRTPAELGLVTTASVNIGIADLDDVALGVLTSGHLLRWNGSAWANATLATAGIASTSTSINAGTGLTGGGSLASNRTINFDTTWGDTRYAASSHTHPWADITGEPVYTTRWPTWTEVTSKPTTFAPSAHSHPWEEITGEPVYTTRWPTWNEVTSKPATFAPAAHTHDSFNVVDIRDTNPAPSAFADSDVSAQFNNAWSGVGSSWRSALSVKGWTGNYSVWQLIGPAGTTADDDWYFRSGAGATWRTPRRILHDGNSGALQVQPPSGSYGSLNIDGTTGGYAGFYFEDVGRYLMMSGQHQGVHTGSAWQWLWTNGSLVTGTIPIARVSVTQDFSMGGFDITNVAGIRDPSGRPYAIAIVSATEPAAAPEGTLWIQPT
ncbi:MAG: hypothetical protein ACYC28_15975, partial [Longimicrobiales bacterium]